MGTFSGLASRKHCHYLSHPYHYHCRHHHMAGTIAKQSTEWLSVRRFTSSEDWCVCWHRHRHQHHLLARLSPTLPRRRAAAGERSRCAA